MSRDGAVTDETTDELAPIDFIVVEVPDGRVSPDGFEVLFDLADRGVVRVLDVEFVTKPSGGAATVVAVADLDLPAEVDLRAWDGASSGLLGADDIAEIGSELAPGSVAVAVVFENRWVLGVVDAWRRHGARLVADGGLSPDDVVAALDATEPT